LPLLYTAPSVHCHVTIKDGLVALTAQSSNSATKQVI